MGCPKSEPGSVCGSRWKWERRRRKASNRWQHETGPACWRAKGCRSCYGLTFPVENHFLYVQSGDRSTRSASGKSHSAIPFKDYCRQKQNRRSRMTEQQASRRNGFTLVELLVVIAIIGILILRCCCRPCRRPARVPTGPVRQQPEADRPGGAKLPVGDSGVSAGLHFSQRDRQERLESIGHSRLFHGLYLGHVDPALHGSDDRLCDVRFYAAACRTRERPARSQTVITYLCPDDELQIDEPRPGQLGAARRASKTGMSIRGCD